MNSIAFSFVVLCTLLLTNLYVLLHRQPVTERAYVGDPDRHSWWRIALSLTATVVGGGMYLAVGQMGFDGGLIGIVVGVAYLAGFSFAAVIAERLRRVLIDTNSNTILQLIECRYSKRMAVQFAIANAIVFVFLLAGQFVALTQFANFASKITHPNWVPWAMVLAGAMSMAMYTVIGGLARDIVADTVQMIIIIISAAIIVWKLLTSDAPVAIERGLQLVDPSGQGYGPTFLIGVLAFVPPSFLVRMDVWQRVRAARSVNGVRLAFVLAGIGSLVFFTLFTIVGTWARGSGNLSGPTATLDLIIAQFSSPILIGLIIGGLFAAAMSSADTYINNGSIVTARLALPLFRTAADSEASLLRAQRMSSIVVIGLAASLTFIAPDFVDLLVGALSLLLVYLFPVFGILYSPVKSERAAFYSSTLGLTTFAYLFFFWNPKLAFVPAVLLSIMVYLVCWAIERMVGRSRGHN